MLLKRYVSVYDNFLNKNQLDKFLRFCKTRDYGVGKVGDDPSLTNNINKKVRDVSICSLNIMRQSYSEVHWANVLQNIFLRHFNDYLIRHNLHQDYQQITNFMQCDILKYGVSNHYKFHVDHGKYENRVLSAIFFLNDDYEGGQLTFKNTYDDTEEQVEKKAGSVVIWPSNFLFPHAVKPVKKGERYTVVAWAN
jgi:Rps23 Pro-64 3,4-dihydroxylase Tpa1-like proline 4-hydroxylase